MPERSQPTLGWQPTPAISSELVHTLNFTGPMVMSYESRGRREQGRKDIIRTKATTGGILIFNLPTNAKKEDTDTFLHADLGIPIEKGDEPLRLARIHHGPRCSVALSAAASEGLRAGGAVYRVLTQTTDHVPGTYLDN